MNPVIIVLGIIVVLLLYYLYQKYVSSPASLQAYQELTSGYIQIDKNNLTGYTSSNYSYSTWVYVNSWNPNTYKTIMSRSSAPIDPDSLTSTTSTTTTTTTLPDFLLWLDTNTPSLYVFIQSSKTPITPSTGSTNTILITNNFPLQTWVQVTVSVSGQIMDIYLNGKLISSNQLADTPQNSTNDLYLGDKSNPDIYLAKVAWKPTPMDPTTAWNNYMGGSGVSSSSGSYNIQLQLLQNKQLQQNWKIY